MNDSLSQLQIIATENANKHKWKVRWNQMLLGNIEEVQKGYRYLSIGDAIALCHSELSEALDAYRNDDKGNFAEEMADTVIRILHLCGDINIDLTTAINQKMLKNQNRPINHGRKNL